MLMVAAKNDAWAEAFGTLGAGIVMISLAEVCRLLMQIEQNTRSKS
jgi:hypothetical protein